LPKCAEAAAIALFGENQRLILTNNTESRATSMKLLQLNTPTENSSKRRCNHPLAVVVDPTDGEICELEAMLAKCPNCSRWLPGDGPIMAVLSSDENNIHPGPKELA